MDDQRAFIAEQLGVLSLQRDELIEQADDRRTQQAREVRVTARLSSSSGWMVAVENASGQPIRDVDVRFGDYVPSRQATDGPVQPGPGPGSPFPVIGPGVQAHFFLNSISEGAMRQARPRIMFRDAANRLWSLDEHEHLEPASPPQL